VLSLPATFVILLGGINLPVLGITWSFAPTGREQPVGRV
jgi:hypothetical protein